jgi:hypothetical protein
VATHTRGSSNMEGLPITDIDTDNTHTHTDSRTIHDPNGFSHEVLLVFCGRRHGYGEYTWVMGDEYRGDWREDKMSGQGEMVVHLDRRYAQQQNNCGIYIQDQDHSLFIKMSFLS